MNLCNILALSRASPALTMHRATVWEILRCLFKEGEEGGRRGGGGGEEGGRRGGGGGEEGGRRGGGGGREGEEVGRRGGGGGGGREEGGGKE